MAEADRESLAAPVTLDAVLIVIAVSGVSFSGPLIAATAAPALAIAFWRNAIGSLVTAPVAILRGRSKRQSIGRADLGITGLAGLALSLHFATWIPSVTMTSVSSATALVATQSVFVAVIAHVRGHRLPRVAWIGIVVSTLGAILITGADIGLSGRALLGDLLALLGGLFAAVYVTIGARARQQISTTVYTAICYAVCAGALVVACLVGRVHLSGYSGNAWFKIVLVTVFAQLLGHSLINLVLRTTSATVVSLAILLEVPGATVVAALWLHQRPSALAIPGLVLLLVGLVVVTRGRPASAGPVELIE